MLDDDPGVYEIRSDPLSAGKQGVLTSVCGAMATRVTTVTVVHHRMLDVTRQPRISGSTS